MKRVMTLAMIVLLVATIASAQSSGNFSYGYGPTACVLQSNGNFSGGVQCEVNCTLDPVTGQPTCTSQTGTCIGAVSAGIKSNSGAGNVFVIRPSAVVGLLTDVTLASGKNNSGASYSIGTSSALAGVDFTVSVTDPTGKPAQTIPSGPITYDARFVQISSNMFNAIASQCLATPTTMPGGGYGCYFSFNESTVSAHSFDWIVPALTTGTYTITTSWQPSLGNTGLSDALTCVGPVNMTVQQNKVFNFNTVN
jgi:hypothetical protein